MEICLPHGKIELFGKVIGACLGKDDKIIGTPNANSFLNTVLYEVQFEDGTSQAYGANLVAENMWRTTNDEEYREDKLYSIVDVCFDPNAVNDSLLIYDKQDKRWMRKTTAGVNLLVAIKNRVSLENGSKKVSKTWILLKDMK